MQFVHQDNSTSLGYEVDPLIFDIRIYSEKWLDILEVCSTLNIKPPSKFTYFAFKMSPLRHTVAYNKENKVCQNMFNNISNIDIPQFIVQDRQTWKIRITVFQNGELLGYQTDFTPDQIQNRILFLRSQGTLV